MIIITCVDCGAEIEIRPQDRGRQTRCRVCYKKFHNRATRIREVTQARKREYIPPDPGGPYRVVYDPLDSFTYCSSFTRNEIHDMLNSNYLADGTLFLHTETGKQYRAEQRRLVGVSA